MTEILTPASLSNFKLQLLRSTICFTNGNLNPDLS